ncbi:E3 ubiquitin-protein ligase [Striga asiatica]|uniref:E3 ubiquitin-protein ligase n=1 Tax=Striga asiatica TaxID=4170 RepID=A0A5A7PCF1_STRAF|nr:E3 ubiquitin-protein ligase [Striga asiatica]
MARKSSKKPRTSAANTRESPQSTYTASPQPAEARGGFGSLDDDDEEMVNLTTPSAMDSENKVPGSLSVTLTDPEVLDCPICLEPLIPPVYQMHNNCGSCSCPIGSSRCRAIERVLDSVRVPCPNALHGCTESPVYNEKLNHEKTCRHSPCSCPHPDCSYTGLPSSVYSHFATIHPTSSKLFFTNSKIHVSLGPDQGYVFLQYELDDTLFVLSRKSLSIGSAVALYCIGPISSERKFVYEVVAVDGVGFVKLKALAETRAVWLRGQLPGNKILFVPKDFVGADGKLQLEVTITRAKLELESITRAKNYKPIFYESDEFDC